MMLNQEHVMWCRKRFLALKDGGAWGVPRSGLLFVKRGIRLVLTARMPWMAEMPITAERLRAQQDNELDLTRIYFGAAGIEVLDESRP